MAVTETARLIAELGVLTVIAAVFILVFITMFRSLRNQNEAMFKKFMSDGHSVEEEEHNERINRSIQDTLDGLLADTNADSAVVFQYHNGGKNRLGIPFQKMSCTHEVVRPGLSGQFSQMQNTLRSLFMIFCNKLKDCGAYCIANAEDLKASDPNWYQMLSDFGVHSSCIFALVSSDGVVFGFVGIFYAFRNLEDPEKTKKFVHERALKISAIIESIRPDGF